MGNWRGRGTDFPWVAPLFSRKNNKAGAPVRGGTKAPREKTHGFLHFCTNLQKGLAELRGLARTYKKTSRDNLRRRVTYEKEQAGP